MLVLHCVHVELLELVPSTPQQVLAVLEVLAHCVDLLTRRVDFRGDFGEQLHGLEVDG